MSRKAMSRLVVPHLVLLLMQLHTDVVQAGGGFDMTGTWRVEFPGLGETVTLYLRQEVTTLHNGNLTGSIDPDSGEFTVGWYRGAPGYLDLRGTLTDINHFVGDVSGFIEILIPPPRYVFVGVVDGTRLPPLATFTPTASPTVTPTPTPPCVGDCDRNGRATIDELVRLVRCLVSPCIEPIGRDAIDCADANNSGSLEVSELVIAVNNMLHGCP